MLSCGLVLEGCLLIPWLRPAPVETDDPLSYSDVQPEFSPDGTTLVFSSDRLGNYDIWQVAADGSGLAQLTDDPADDLDPTYSPDGSQILFDSYRRGSPARLYLMTAAGADEREIPVTAAGGIFPAWSRDGMQIAFACGSAGNRVGICVMDAQGMSARILVDSLDAREWEPSWSPDGTRIAFVSDADGDDEIYVIDVATRVTEQLTDNDVPDAGPAWSPDGSRIAFDSRADDIEIHVMDADGGNAIRLTYSDGAVAPSWSPDGTRIAYHGRAGDVVRIFTMAADGSDVRQVTQ